MNEKTNKIGREVRESADETASNMRTAVDATADISQRAAAAATDLNRLMVQTTERSVDQFAKVFGFSGENAKGAAQQSSENLQAMVESSTVLAKGIQDISSEWIRLAQSRVTKNLDGFDALLRCRSVQDLVAVQSELARDNMEQILNNSRHIAERSVQVASEAAQKIVARAKQSADRARRAA